MASTTTAQRPRVEAAENGRLAHNECRKALEQHNIFVFFSAALLVSPIPELWKAIRPQLQGPAGGSVERVKHRNLGKWSLMAQALDRQL